MGETGARPTAVTSAHRSEPFLRRVHIRNYKSIGRCHVALGGLTALVGRNGSGKSNFLDALRFLSDSLQTSLDHAFKTRGGIDAVRRRSTGHPHNFAIQLEINLPDWRVGRYGFEIGSRPQGKFFVKQEQLNVVAPDGRVKDHYVVQDGQIASASVETMPPAASDRLYLVHAAGVAEFRPVFDALAAMGFYNLNPEAMKELQCPDAEALLDRDGSNIASVIGRMSTEQPEVKARIKSYLSTICPWISDVDRVTLGPRETLEFRQDAIGSSHGWTFYAMNMSDGVLRALGTLVAVTQSAERNCPVRVVGIEEPETSLHPAASGALMEAIREAATRTQVLLTSHSPEILDQLQLQEDRVLAVQSSQGITEIGAIDPASGTAIREHLHTAGELLRMDQLKIDDADVHRQQQAELFNHSDA